MTTFIHILSAICIISGSVIMLIGVIGLIRLPDLYTRLHALSLIDTMGMLLLSLGMMLQSGWTLITFKLLLMALLVLCTAAVASHALAKTAYEGGHRVD